MPTQRFATILPLHYDIRPLVPTVATTEASDGATPPPSIDMVDRVEHSVIYYSSDLEELVDLLFDPVRFFAASEGAWGQKEDPASDPLPVRQRYPWKLKAPVTAIIRPIEEGHVYSSVIGAEVSGVSGEGEAPLTTGFIAEFAIGTSILSIYYHVPTEPGASRFPGGFTEATLGLLDTGFADKKPGSLHVDLEFHPERNKFEQRAQHVVDLIHGSAKLKAHLDNHENVVVGTATPVAQGQDIVFVQATAQPVTFTLNPTPVIVVEGLSTTDDGPKCCNSSGYWVGGDFFVDGTVIKNYVCPTCPPVPPVPPVEG